jgi:hypothetical protein
MWSDSWGPEKLQLSPPGAVPTALALKAISASLVFLVHAVLTVYQPSPGSSQS